MLRSLLPLVLFLAACAGGSGASDAGDSGGASGGDSGDSGSGSGGDSGGGDSGGSAVDADGDGYGVNADCDDTSAAIHPGATETCNGVDDDCDELIDDADPDLSGAPSWSTDGDLDGWGDQTTAVRACSPPSSAYVRDGGDCDDADPAVHPEAAERCNGDDDDCDGRIDDDDDDVTDATAFHADADGDGYGDPDALVWGCELPYGATEDTTDCDDGDRATHPGGQEVCGGGDEDCDGRVDDADDSVDLATGSTFHADADGDGYGDPDVTVVACAAPAGTVMDAADCDDARGAVHPGAAEVIGNGLDDDCDGVDAVDADGDGHASLATGGDDCDDADAATYPGAPDLYGDGVDRSCDGVDGADVDLDGFADAASGGDDCDDADPEVNPDAPERWGDGVDDDCDGWADTAFASGLVYVAHGSSTSYDLDDMLVPVGDVDADGRPDLVVGGGYAHLLLGPHTADHEVGSRNLFGRSTAATGAGDLDGDGVDDLVLGLYNQSVDGHSNAGVAWLFYGPLYAAVDTDLADATVVGGASGEYAGGTVTAVGDLDGDGAPDVAVSAYQDSGELGIFSGAWTGQRTMEDAGATVTGTGRSWADTPVAAADIDGDGQNDLVLGVGVGEGTAGAAYLLFGPITGDVDVADADWSFGADHAGTYYGETVVAGPDIDGDGGADILIGPDSGSGGVVAFGPWAGRTADLSTVGAQLVTEGSSDCSGGNCDATLVDDLDGDGFGEIVVGVGGAAGAAGASSGRGYVLFGPVSGTVDLGAADCIVEGESAGDDFGYRVGVIDADADGGIDLLFTAKDAGGQGRLYRFDPLE